MGYIYKITNKTNGKIYIGLTTKSRPTDRFSQHRYLARHPDQERSVSYLHKAMLADGLDNFCFEIIEQIDNELLNKREQYWIQYYDSYIPNGYNLTTGGEGTKSFSRPQSEEEKQQRSESMKNYFKQNPKAIEEIRQRTLDLWQNEEYRKKVTESNKKFYKEHPDMFRGKNNPMYGKRHTEEALKKIRAYTDTLKLKIAQLDKETLEVIKIYDGVKEAERALGVSHGWISKAAKQNRIAYGYRWKFI